MPDVLKMIFYILVFIAVLYGAFYFSKFMASMSNGFSKSKYMKIADKLMLTKDKSVAIIKVGKKNMLLSITNDGVKLMQEIDEEDMIPINDEADNQSRIIPYNNIIVKEAKRCITYIVRYFKKPNDDDNQESITYAFKAILSQKVLSHEAEILKENVDEN